MTTVVVTMVNWNFIKKPSNQFIKWLLIINSTLACITSFCVSYILYINEIKYESVLFFFGNISMFIGVYYIGVWSNHKNALKNIETKNGVFSSTLDYLPIDKLMFYLYWAVMIFNLIFKYSNEIYPIIDDYMEGQGTNINNLLKNWD